jgi:RNase adaptor protein for sRNA GlmZ degradation
MPQTTGPEIILTSYSTDEIAPAAMLTIDVSNVLTPYRPSDPKVTGQVTSVRAAIANTAGAKRLIDNLLDTAETMLSVYRGVVTLAIGSEGGRIRAVALVDELGAQLADARWRVQTRHRDLRRATPAESSVRRPHSAVAC